MTIPRPAAPMLSEKIREAIAEECLTQNGLAVRWLDQEGVFTRPEPADSPLALPELQQAVIEAMEESYRWGETHVFFLCPGVISWVVPLCEEDRLRGGLLSGGVILDDSERVEAEQLLTALGFPADRAHTWARQLPLWSNGQVRQASLRLYRTFYSRTGWMPTGLDRRREDAAQQRQVAEAIHSRKSVVDSRYPLDDERRLLAMVHAGDQRGAQMAMNELLAGLFVHAPSLPLLRARSVELLGHLVRSSIEENPMLEPLIEQNPSWIERLISAPGFDELCAELRSALNAFIQSVSTQAMPHVPPAVQRALNHISQHYASQITLAEVAEAVGLSRYRIAHLVKEHTGRPIMEHVRVLRMAKARQLLVNTQLTGTQIATDLGYYDQSHFTKEFKALTGTTPSRYRRQSRPLAAAEPA